MQLSRMQINRSALCPFAEILDLRVVETTATNQPSDTDGKSSPFSYHVPRQHDRESHSTIS